MTLGSANLVFSFSLLPGRCQIFPNGHWQLSFQPPAEVRAGAATLIYDLPHLPGPLWHKDTRPQGS